VAEWGTAIKGRTLIMGVGNELRGDDGVGPFVARALVGKVALPVIEAGEVPENYGDRIRAARPDTVLVIDAVDFGGQPGEVALFTVEEIAERVNISTHGPSLRILATYVRETVGAEVVLLGIQPATTAFGVSLTPEVRKAGERVVRWVESWAG